MALLIFLSGGTGLADRAPQDTALPRPELSWSELACNWLFGLSALSWSVLGLVHAAEQDRWTTVRLTIAVLHMVVGFLFITRSPVRMHGSLVTVAASMGIVGKCPYQFELSESEVLSDCELTFSDFLAIGVWPLVRLARGVYQQLDECVLRGREVDQRPAAQIARIHMTFDDDCVSSGQLSKTEGGQFPQ